MANTKNKFEFFKDNKDEFRWRKVAGNNKVVGSSSESFTTKGAVIKNAQMNGYKGEGKRGFVS